MLASDDSQPFNPRKETKNGRNAYVFFQETQTPNYHCCFQSYSHVPTPTTCGRLPANVSVCTMTHNRTPHTQRLSLATELSGGAVACQTLHFSSVCTAVSPRKCGAAAQYINCTAAYYCLFLSSPCALHRLYHAICAIQLASIVR